MSAVLDEVTPALSPARGPNPFVGPKPFEEKDERLFFGRDTESQQLVAHILAGPITLLYAESGAGKTSLLRAKVIPTLERSDQSSIQRPEAADSIACEILGKGRVSGPAMDDTHVWPNVFTANILLTFMSIDELAQKPELTLKDYLFARPPRATPRKTAIRPPRVLILDQFEELFTTGSEWWSHREPFFRDLGEALDADPRLRVVIAMREEYIANLDAYVTLVPGALRTRFRLQRLRDRQAIEAVRKPLEKGGVGIDDAALTKLLNSLRAIPAVEGRRDRFGEFIEPLHLQVVCSRLWTSLSEKDDVITEPMVNAHGDIDAALTGYYEESLSEVTQEHRRIREGQIRSWFERELITEHKTRGIVFRGDRMTGTLPNDVVDSIQAKYLIRPELRGGGQWYELSHDRMIQPVLASGQRWRESQRSGLILRKIEDAARNYAAAPATTELIPADELREADNYLASEEGRGYVWSPPARDYVQASRLAAQQARTKKMVLLVVVLVLGLIGAVGAIVGVFTLKERADRAVWEAQNGAASTFLRQDKNFDALAWAIRAYGTLRDQGEAPPRAVVDVLRRASDRVSDDIWLRPPAPVARMVFSRNGKYAATIGGKQLCRWEIASTTKRCVSLPERDPEPREGSGDVVTYISNDGNALIVSPEWSALDGRRRSRVYDGGLKVVVDNARHASGAPEIGLIAYTGEGAGKDDEETLRLYDTSTGTSRDLGALPRWKDGSPAGNRGYLSPRGKYFVQWEYRDELFERIFRISDGTMTPAPINESKASMVDVTFAGDDEHAFVIRNEDEGRKRTLTIYSSDTWTPLRVIALGNGEYVRPNAAGSRLLRTTRAARPTPTVPIVNRVTLDEMRLDGSVVAQPKASITERMTWGPDRFLFRNEKKKEWAVWRPFENWTTARTFSPSDSVTNIILVAPEGPEDTLAAIHDGAVRIFTLDKPKPKSNLSSTQLFARACRQLKHQSEYQDIKTICEPAAAPR